MKSNREEGLVRASSFAPDRVIYEFEIRVTAKKVRGKQTSGVRTWFTTRLFKTQFWLIRRRITYYLLLVYSYCAMGPTTTSTIAVAEYAC